VIAEHDNQSLKAATLNTVAAALQCSPEVDVLVAGNQSDGAVRAAAQIAGVRKVIQIDAPQLADQLAEPLAAQILSLANHYSHILAPATANGKNVLPRIAAKLDVAQLSDITKVITVRTTGFDPVAATGGLAVIEKQAAVESKSSSSFVGRQLTKSDRPELTAAKIIVSGGRGLGSGEKYQELVAPLADKLGAALGASRAAVDAGYAPNDYQVGQTGKIVAPELYIAIGISGAIQHLAGMKDSKVIVAINKDPEAPIFGVADYGLVADLNTAVPELTKALS
jgi:electron transfer flavoprotein alpha subunit